MPDHRLAKQHLVSTPVGDKHSVGGQKRRWNDVVSNDLRLSNLSETWREQVHERDSWHATIKHSAELLNIQAEANEKSLKDEKMRRHEQWLVNTQNALHCDHLGCSFRALTKVGLTNHQRQCHSTISRFQCQYCQQTFSQ